MPARSRSDRPRFHRAFLYSVAIHLALAGVIVLSVRSRPVSESVPPRVETGVDVVVRMFDAGPALEIQPPDPPSAAQPIPTEPPPSDSPSVPSPELPRRPHQSVAPRILSAEVISAIDRTVTARHTVGSSPPAAAVLHGAMQSGQVIVYLLDCSGSMGEHGKLALARVALLQTLRTQPEGVRFQIVIYDGTARALFPGTECVPATAANIEAVAARLLDREAMGRSNHIVALQTAARFRPDAILLLTDAGGLGRDQLRAGLARLEKPAFVFLVRISASRIDPPIELR